MTPSKFIEKWKDNPLSERAGAQTYFLDLCDMIGVDKPNDPESYCFERGATRTGAGHGWADVWKRNHFAWENKGPGGDLARALKQLMTYALALDNPPLLVVSNRDLIEIHTHFTGTPSELHSIQLAEIGEPENQQKLHWLFTSPEKFLPSRTVLDVTGEAAGRFAEIAQSLQSRGNQPERIAHFLIQCLFCMFAEDSGLLPAKLFQRIVSKSVESPDRLAARLEELFHSMRVGREFMLEEIAWFNGGLFEIVEPIPLEQRDVQALFAASQMNWSHIEPSIFGTMFERGLDPSLRSQLGANYTDPGTIGKIVDSVITSPLLAEWEHVRATISANMANFHAGGKGSKSAQKVAQEAFLRFLERVASFRVLDPACGSGNFLYLALRALKDLEHRANLDAEMLGLHRQITINASPANVLGIEINTYAAELARVTVWIGEIQWMLKNGYDIRRRPILAPLQHIECRDALLNEDGTESAWPTANVILGNPPFLGDKRMRRELGDEYVDALRSLYGGRVPGGADLVVYWFEKARVALQSELTTHVGLVATNSIRQPTNRKVVEQLLVENLITDAWPDEPWINDGAAVRVSIVCFARRAPGVKARLDGQLVRAINSDLSATPIDSDILDLTKARPLRQNQGGSYFGMALAGSFTIDEQLALRWLRSPNPNGRPNSDVIRPLWNGTDVTGRWNGRWVIDFGPSMSEEEASLYELPFQHVLANVRAKRATNREQSRAQYWWRHGRPRPELRKALADKTRFIATSEKSKHRFFVWLPTSVAPDHRLIAFPTDLDAVFGVLSSRIHVCWALAVGSTLEDRPAYATGTCFEKFAFPEGLTPDLWHRTIDINKFKEVAEAAKLLNQLRETWLNPVEWAIRVPAPVPAFPDLVVAKPGFESDLKRRTLTNLYNVRPAWLEQIHQSLDLAVAKAYGWHDYTRETTDDELLRRLFDLNRSRSV